MAKLELIKPGDVLYDVHSERMGNTTMRKMGIWECYVKEVHVADGWALISWNGNPPTRYRRPSIEKLRKSKPKKMNGHLHGCYGYHGGLMWGRNCTCDEIRAKSPSPNGGR